MPNRTLSRSLNPNPNPSTYLNPSLTQSQLSPGAYNTQLTQALGMRLLIFMAQSQIHKPILVRHDYDETTFLGLFSDKIPRFFPARQTFTYRISMHKCHLKDLIKVNINATKKDGDQLLIDYLTEDMFWTNSSIEEDVHMVNDNNSDIIKGGNMDETNMSNENVIDMTNNDDNAKSIKRW